MFTDTQQFSIDYEKIKSTILIEKFIRKYINVL